jgi:DMSO/TMAO reductase YedYZ molybdopterin-dependent catalytic subunit
MASEERPRVVMDPAVTTRVLVPVARLTSFLTPTPDLFVLAHMGIAHVPLADWSLAIEGAVERPRRLGYAELTAMPSRSVTSVHECFGNPVEPDVPTRRVGNVQWTGAPLRDVLRAAGPRPGASHVWLEGADSGMFANVASDRYAKDLPLEAALAPDVLLAWALNGEPLSAEHGFPVRAVVPGFFGTNSVKWLTRIRVADGRLDGFFTTTLYNREVVVDGVRERQPVRELDVHAVIVRPAEGDAVAVGPQTIDGWAWSAWEVRTVDVSTDGGASWRAARVGAREGGHAWQPFTLLWNPDAPGRYHVQARATDARQRVQPRAGRNRIHTITVTVT